MKRTWLDIIASLIIVFIFVSVQVYASFNGGVLSLPPTYDDVGYFLDAATRIQQFHSGGLSALIAGYVSNPPHAPGSTALAATAFVMAGLKPAAVVAINAVPLFILIFIAMNLTREFPFILAGLLVSSFLLIPIFGLAVTECRPDMWAAFFTTASVFWITFGDPHCRKRDAIIPSISIAIALLMKPTFAPLIIILFAISILLRFMPLFHKQKNWFALTKALGYFVFIPAIFAGPHYVLAAKNLFNYYALNVFGSAAVVWSPDVSKLSGILYYLTGPGGSPTIGPWLIFIGLSVLLIILFIRQKNYRSLWAAISIGILSSIAFIIVTVPAFKSPFVGIIFPAMMVGAISLSFIEVFKIYIQRNARAVVIGGIVLLLIFGAAVFKTPFVALHGANATPLYASDRWKMLKEVAETIPPATTSKERVLITQIGQYLNAHTLSFHLMQQERPVPIFTENILTSDPSVFKPLLAQANYVIALTPDNSSILQWLPVAKISAKINDLIMPSEFDLIRSIPEAGGMGQVKIFRRKQ